MDLRHIPGRWAGQDVGSRARAANQEESRDRPSTTGGQAPEPDVHDPDAAEEDEAEATPQDRPPPRRAQAQGAQEAGAQVGAQAPALASAGDNAA